MTLEFLTSIVEILCVATAINFGIGIGALVCLGVIRRD